MKPIALFALLRLRSFISLNFVCYSQVFVLVFLATPPQLPHLFVGKCTRMQYAVIQSSSDIASRLSVPRYIIVDQLEASLCGAYQELTRVSTLRLK